MKKMNKRKIAILGGIALMVIGIIITLVLINSQQDLRQRADTSQSVSITFDPSQGNYNVFSTISTKLKINTGSLDVGSIEITIENTPQLQFVSFTPQSPFTIIDETKSGTSYHFVMVNPTKTPVTGADVTLGTFTFLAQSSGTATIQAADAVRVTASGLSDYATVSNLTSIKATYTITNTLSPTPVITAPITQQPTATQAPSPTPTPSPLPTTTPIPTPTIAPNATTVEFNLKLPGIASNQALSGSGQLNNNEDPRRKTREIEVRLESAEGADVTALASGSEDTAKGVVTFDPATFSYKGRVDLGDLPSGSYIVMVRMDNTLYSQIPGFPVITKEQNTQLAAITLIPGDINRNTTSNDELDLEDWSLFLACYHDQPACTDNDAIHADFQDDGDIDIDELNILQRGFERRTGASKS